MKPQTPSANVETGFLSHSVVLGSLAGTRIRLHWTLLLYLVWLGVAFLIGGGAGAAVSGVLLVIAVFACVLAHEFGHILTARRFGIASPDVTLLPIGGIARLQAIPERPGQELAVALAGPAVNLIIAALLILALGPDSINGDLAVVVRPADILPALTAINLFLALFNLLPAFPMDGGRALRAVLAIFIERGRATRIAARVGQGCAVGLGLMGLLSGNVVLTFIAMFVYFAASAEAQEVQLHRLAEQLRTADAMVTELPTLLASDTLDDASRLLLRSGQREFPVLDDQGEVAGILTHEGIIGGLKMHGPHLPVAQAMRQGLLTIPARSPLEDALRMMESNSQPLVVLDDDGQFAGLLTRENLGELLLLASAQPHGKSRILPATARGSEHGGESPPIVGPPSHAGRPRGR